MRNFEMEEGAPVFDLTQTEAGFRILCVSGPDCDGTRAGIVETDQGRVYGVNWDPMGFDFDGDDRYTLPLLAGDRAYEDNK